MTMLGGVELITPTPARAVDILESYGSERLWLNSATPEAPVGDVVRLSIAKPARSSAARRLVQVKSITCRGGSRPTQWSRRSC